MRFVIRLLVTLGVLGLATVVLGNFAERWVIYPFDATHVAPSDTGLTGVEEISYENDGETLLAWVAPPAPGKPVVLYFHGNAGNLAAREGRFKLFLARGYGLFAPAYRGSSGSSGTPNEKALIWDAETAYHAMFDHLSGLRADQVVLYGESLGTAVALALLNTPSVHPGKSHGPPAAVILEAPFTSVPALAEHHYPGTGTLAGNLDNTWQSLSRAPALTMPLLILHGTEDDLIPIEMGRQIFSAAPSRDKDFHVVKGAGHTNLWRRTSQSRLWRFVDQFALR